MDYRIVTPEHEYSKCSPMSSDVRNMGDVEGRKSVIDYFDDIVDGDNVATSSSSNDRSSDSELDERRRFIQSQLQALSGAVPKSPGGAEIDLRRTDRPGGAYAGTAAAVNHNNEQDVVPQLTDWDKKDPEPPNSAWLGDSSKRVVTFSAGEKKKLLHQSEDLHDVNIRQKNAMDVQQTLYCAIIRMLRMKARNCPHEGLQCGVEVCKIIAKQGKHVMPALNKATHVAGFRKGLIGWLELRSKLKGEIIVQRNYKGGTVWLMTDAPESVKGKIVGSSRKKEDSSSSSDSYSSGDNETESDSSIGNKVMNGSGSSRTASLDRNRQRYENGESHGGKSSWNHAGSNSKGLWDVDHFRHLSTSQSRSGGHSSTSSSTPHRWQHSSDVSSSSYGDRNGKRSINKNRERDKHKCGSSYYDGRLVDERRRSHGGDSRLDRWNYFGNQSDFCGGDRDRRRSISGKSHNDFGEGSGIGGEHKQSCYGNSRGSGMGKGSDNGGRDSRDWDRQHQYSETYHGGRGGGGSRGQQQPPEKLDVVNSSSSSIDSTIDNSRKDLSVILPPPDSPPPPDSVMFLTSPNLPLPSQTTTTTFSDDVCHQKEDEKKTKYEELPVLHQQRLKEVKGQQEDIKRAAETLSQQQQSQEEQGVPSSRKEDVQAVDSNDLPQKHHHHQSRDELQWQSQRQSLEKEKEQQQLAAKEEKMRQHLQNQASNNVAKEDEICLSTQRQKVQQQGSDESECKESDSSIYNFCASDDDGIIISACSCESRRAEIVTTSNGVPASSSSADATNMAFSGTITVDASVDECPDSLDSSLHDDRPCDACSFPDPRYQGDELDDIVYCDSCNVPVHQACYRISEIPSGEWFCDVCANNIDPDEIPCGFCPVIGGAMKRCKGGEEEGWAHLSCAYFIDELDVETVDGVTYIGVDPSRYEKSQSDGGSTMWSSSSNRKGGWKGKHRNNSNALLTRTFGLRNYAFGTQKCMVCKLDLQGLLINCQVHNCKSKFHASCAAHADALNLGILFSNDGSYKCAPVKCSRHAGIDVIEGIRSVETPITIKLKRWAAERHIVSFPRKGKDAALVGKLMYHSPISKMFCIVSEGQQVRWVQEGIVMDALGYEIIRHSSEPPTLVMKSTSNPETTVSAHVPSVTVSGPPSASSKIRLIKSEIDTDSIHHINQKRPFDGSSVTSSPRNSGQIEKKGRMKGGGDDAAVAVAVESSSKGGDKSITKPEHHYGGDDEDIPAVSTMTASSSTTTTTLLSVNVNEWRFHGGYDSGRLIAGLSMATSIQKVELETRDSGQPIYFVQPCMVSPALHLPTVEPLCEKFEFELEKSDRNKSVDMSDSSIVEKIGGNSSSSTSSRVSSVPNSSCQFASEVTTASSSVKHKGAKIDGSSDMGTSTDSLLLSSTAGSSRRDQGGGTAAHDGSGDKNRSIHHVRFSSTSSSSIRDPRLSLKTSSAVSSTSNRLPPVSRTLSSADPRVTAQPPKERTTGLGKK